jgi:GTP-binding protein HflX
VDGSDPDPEAQIDAVREVLREIGADRIPEIIVINKADAADDLALARLQRREPHSVVVSARTGFGIDELRAAIEADLPGLESELHVLVPYERGDLVAQVHERGEVLKQDHVAEGTVLHARVPAGLAGELAQYETVSPTA